MSSKSNVTFPVWRTIRHVGQRNAESYREGLASAECKISDWANDILNCFETTSIDEEIDLGYVFVEELGFKKATWFGEICDRILSLGHSLCLPEDGPVLREQYLVQPLGWRVRLAMKAIRDSGGDLDIFYLGHGECGLFLYRDYGGVDALCDPDDQLVFRLGKRPLVA